MSTDLSNPRFDQTSPQATHPAQDIMEIAFCCVAQFSGAVSRQANLVEALAYFRAAFDLSTIVIQRTTNEKPVPRRVASVGIQSFSTDRYRADSFALPAEELERGAVQTARSLTGGIVVQIVLKSGASATDVVLFEFPRLADRAQITALTAMAPAMVVAWGLRQPGFVSGLIHAHAVKRKTTSPLGQEADILGVDNAFGLSRAEFRVCRLLASGLKPQLIAEELGVSITTVRTHLSSIYAKTDLPGQLEVVSHINRSAHSVSKAA